MRNILYFFGCMILCISCSNPGQNTVEAMNPNNTSYKVYKLDSINSYYLIYVSRRDTNYKILSKKESKHNCFAITPGSYYDFELLSMLPEEMMTAGFDCIWVDSTTKVCPEDSIFDLMYASNIKGLCYEKEKQENDFIK